MIKYHFALECDEIIPIEKVNRDERHSHTYKCLGCGAEMIPKMGDKNAWHFAHYGHDGDNCSSETYLHKLAKRLIKEKFDSSTEFKIKYKRSGSCSNIKECVFKEDYQCAVEESKSYNLKEFYDTCQEESPVGSFIADLLLTSSTHPKREPVLIEVVVTHKCTEEKLDSGLRIIELKIDSEETIKSIVQYDEWKEGRLFDYDCDSRKRQTDKCGLAFHNFDRKVSQIGQRDLPRFILYYSGKARISYENCHNIKRKIDHNSIFEVSINTDMFSFVLGYIIASIRIPNFKSCWLCKYHKVYSNMFMEDKSICCLYKKKGTPKEPIPNYANQCQYYCADQEMMKQYKLNFPDYVVAEQDY